MEINLKKQKSANGFIICGADEASIKYLKALTEGTKISIDVPEKLRTRNQNKALHLYCTQLAKKLNDAGYTQERVLAEFNHSFVLPWTMEAIKALFRVCSEAMYKKTSTAKLTTTEMTVIYQAFDARIAEITEGVRIDWPTY